VVVAMVVAEKNTHTYTQENEMKNWRGGKSDTAT